VSQKRSLTKTVPQKEKKVLPSNITIIPDPASVVGTYMPLSDSQKADLRFEYEQLRQEIIHNDTLTLQIIGAILVLSGVLLPIAFAKDTNIPHRWLLFLGMEVIAFLGLYQNTERLKGTLVAASYNKIFIESKIEHIKWETRLQKFQDNKNRGGDLIMHQVWIYAMLIFGNFYFAQYFFLQEYKSYHFIIFSTQFVITSNQIILVGLITSILLFCLQLYTSLRLNMKNTAFYDKAWLDVRDGKPRGSTNN